MSALPVPPLPLESPAVAFIADWPADVELPPQNLPVEDGEDLGTGWHRDAINLLVELVRSLFLGRNDFFVGGNMFIHFCTEQVYDRSFRPPDFFYVDDVDGSYARPYWAVWNESGRYPHLIVELLSPSTQDMDRVRKKHVYERTFRMPEYFLYDPDTQVLEGWRLDGRQRYQPIKADERGRMWSQQLGVWIGKWTGQFQGWLEDVWLRFFTEAGELVPLFAEREKGRGDKAEAELARMRALLTEKGLKLPE